MLTQQPHNEILFNWVTVVWVLTNYFLAKISIFIVKLVVSVHVLNAYSQGKYPYQNMYYLWKMQIYSLKPQ